MFESARLTDPFQHCHVQTSHGTMNAVSYAITDNCPQIAIEGNIAAGKSTLLEKLQISNVAQVTRCAAASAVTSAMQIIVEPVEQWQTVIDGEDGNIMVRPLSLCGPDSRATAEPHVQGPEALGVHVPELCAADDARGAPCGAGMAARAACSRPRCADQADEGHGALSVLGAVLLRREPAQVVCGIRCAGVCDGACSEPPLIDDLEYKVYQRWFDYLMERSAPQLDLIGAEPTNPHRG